MLLYATALFHDLEIEVASVDDRAECWCRMIAQAVRAQSVNAEWQHRVLAQSARAKCWRRVLAVSFIR